jgi:hypothetical protein
MKHTLFITLIFLMTACAPASTSTPEPVSAVEETVLPASATPSATDTPTLIPPTETPSPIPTFTPIPTVESLKAKGAADKIICRYGPGANYLYLIAFNNNIPLRLIGRTEGKSNWVLVENGQQDCWVDSQLVAVNEGDPQALPIVYPNGYKIPVSPYYGPTTVLTATREGDEVTITWAEVIVSPGKYEDVNMFPYIVEVWYCKDGEIIFDTLGARVPSITFIDQAGCIQLSHGRVFIQEKHGFAGPADIPWPER